MFIGLAGTAAASGFSVTIYEWHVSIHCPGGLYTGGARGVCILAVHEDLYTGGARVIHTTMTLK